MRLVRSVLALFLAIALLPWGAYAEAAGSGAGETRRIVGVEDAPDAGAAAVARPAGDREAAASARGTRRCPGPALPGASCGPDRVLPAATAAVSPQGQVGELCRVAAPRLSGRIPSGMLDPPRFV